VELAFKSDRRELLESLATHACYEDTRRRRPLRPPKKKQLSVACPVKFDEGKDFIGVACLDALMPRWTGMIIFGIDFFR
jgi:hypothetical protein